MAKDNAKTEDGWQEVDPRTDTVHDFMQDSTLVGTYIARQEEVGPNSSTLYQVQKDDGEKVGVWGNSVLNDRFNMIQIGDRVKIVYTGKETSEKTGRQYHNYQVYHKQADFKEV